MGIIQGWGGEEQSPSLMLFLGLFCSVWVSNFWYIDWGKINQVVGSGFSEFTEEFH